MRVLLPSGTLLEIYDGVTSVADIRVHIAEKLGAQAAHVHLLAGSDSLQDTDTPCSDELTAVLSPIPVWYPQGKYVHDGKDVLKVRFGRLYVDDEFGDSYDYNFVEIQYLDGTTQGSTEDPTEGDFESNVMTLLQEWQFVKHTLEDHEGRSEGGGYTILSGSKEIEAVPREDPAKWERCFCRFSGTSNSEKRCSQ